MITRVVTKSSIDKAGRILATADPYGDEAFEMEMVFDEYRKSHLHPLSEMTLQLQSWLGEYRSKYYIAQRLKRKPQILRKLRRLSVRLTQLQDIGGCRIVVSTNADVERLLTFLRAHASRNGPLRFVRETDYRHRGRDDSGYRAVHVIIEHSARKLELQIRSRIQHYWAESIERTSIIYGHYLKELQGHPVVVRYYKELSELFFEIESGRMPQTAQKLKLEELRHDAESLILQSDKHRVFDSYVNEGIIKTLVEKEKALGSNGLNNWIIVFDWNQGCFISWDTVARDPDEAIQKYIESERVFPVDDGYEVVLVGSSDVATLRETHSHYFGIERRAAVLESLDESIIGFSRRMDIDVGARQILAYMHRKHFWGRKTIAIETLRNHYCRNVLTFDSSLEALLEKGLVHRPSATAGIALDLKRKTEIEGYL